MVIAPVVPLALDDGQGRQTLDKDLLAVVCTNASDEGVCQFFHQLIAQCGYTVWLQEVYYLRGQTPKEEQRLALIFIRIAGLCAASGLTGSVSEKVL